MSDEYTRHGGPLAGGNFPLAGLQWKWVEIEAGVHAMVVVPYGSVESDALRAARDGRSFVRYVSSVTPGAAATVLTATTLVHNITASTRLVIASLYYQVESVSDNCIFYLGSANAINGGGTFVAYGPLQQAFTGATPSVGTYQVKLLPPYVFSHAAGMRSVTFRVDANDANCIISCGFSGWVEPE